MEDNYAPPTVVPTPTPRLRFPRWLVDRLRVEAEKFGGIGAHSNWADGEYTPLCAQGFAYYVDTIAKFGRRPDLYEETEYDGPVYRALTRAGFSVSSADYALSRAGVFQVSRIPFDRWLEILDIEIVDDVSA